MITIERNYTKKIIKEVIAYMKQKRSYTKNEAKKTKINNLIGSNKEKYNWILNRLRIYIFGCTNNIFAVSTDYGLRSLHTQKYFPALRV